MADTAALADFFRALEAQRSTLGVDAFSIGMSTLEEVFLQLSEQSSSIDKSKGQSKKHFKHEKKLPL